METLTSTRLYAALLEDISGDNDQHDTKEDMKMLKEFIDTVREVSDGNVSRYSILRTLYIKQCEFTAIADKAQKKQNEHIQYLAKTAMLIVDKEIELQKLAIEKPGIREPAPTFVSPLHLSSNHSQTDLVEMISGTHITKLACLVDGSPARLEDIIPIYEWIYNVKIDDFGQKLNAAINRKKGAAQYLLSMVDALVEKSQR